MTGYRLELQEESEQSVPRNEIDKAVIDEIRKTFSKQIKVSPGWENDYLLRPKGCVGQIPVTDEFHISIRPKVPISNLFGMLEYAYNLKSFRFLEGTVNVESMDEIFERLASILAKRVMDRARKGLYRSYIEERDIIPCLRGRLRMMQSIRNSIKGSTWLSCEYEEHTADLEDNQILAWTLNRLPRFNLRRDDVRRDVRQAYRALAGAVSVRRMDSKDCVGRFYHRLNDDYSPMHGLCRFFLDHCGPSAETGDRELLPFLVDMPNLFETFVARWLQENLPDGLRVEEQYRTAIDENKEFTFRIDLVLRDTETDEVLAVMDTKYKRPEKPDNNDLNQAVSYAVHMNTTNAFLIYPSPRTRQQSLRWGGGKVTVDVLNFDVGRDLEEAGRVFLENLEKRLMESPSNLMGQQAE